MYGCESWTIKKAEGWRTKLLNCGVGEESWESLELQGDPTDPSWRKSVLNIHWKDDVEAETPILWPPDAKNTHWKRPWWGERLKVGGEGDGRGWDGWMASLTQWTWVWINSRSWWWADRPGELQSMEWQSQTRGHDWVTELNSTGRQRLISFRCTI